MKKGAIGGDPDVGGKVVGIGGFFRSQAEAAGEVFQGVTEAPGFDPEVVHVDHHGNDEAKDAEVRGSAAFPDGPEDTRAGVVAALAPETAHRPFRPGDRQADEQQGDEIGDEEGSAVVFGGEAGEAEEVAEADGTASNGEDDAEGGAPAVFFAGRHGLIVSRSAIDSEAFLEDRS